MKNNNWNEFWNSGSIYDYLNYKNSEKAEDDDDFNEGFGNQRTDNRGE